MKSVYISDELHRQAKLRAAEAGIPLKQLLEEWVAQGLVRGTPQPASEPPQTREMRSTYVTSSPASIVTTAEPDWLALLTAEGFLVPTETVQRSLAAFNVAMRQQWGLPSPPSDEPISPEEARAILRRQRELHPDLPSAAAMLLAMREE